MISRLRRTSLWEADCVSAWCDLHRSHVIVLNLLLGSILAGGLAHAEGTIETIALNGQAVPGDEASTFDDFEAPLINQSGQLVFVARLDDGAQGVFVYDPLVPDDRLQQVAKQGEIAPETDSAGIARYGTVSRLLISQRDRIAMETSHSGGTSAHGIYLPAGPSPFATIGVVRRGDPAPGIWNFRDVRLRGLSGSEGALTRVLFTGSLQVPDGVGNDSGLYLAANAIMPGSVAFATEGERESSGGDRFESLHNVTATMNASGLVVFAAGLSGGDSGRDSGIYSGHWSTTRTRLVREGDAAPGGGTFPDLRDLPLHLNNVGQVAFSAQVDSADFRVFRVRSGETPEVVVRSETAAPWPDGSEDGMFTGTHRNMVFNDAGQVAFMSALYRNSLGIDNDSGIFRSGSGGTVAIAREDQRVSGGEFDHLLRDPRKLSLNSHGLVAFCANLRNTDVADQDKGIFLSDGEAIETVALEGTHLTGSTRTVRVLSDRCIGNQSLSESGQVAFVARLSGGVRGVFLYTPDFEIRPPDTSPLPDGGGFWGAPGVWRYGGVPGPMHRVRLFADRKIRFGGPEEPTVIRGLVIDAAEKAAMNLVLSQGPLVIRETLDIGPRGRVEIAGLLVAQGKTHNAGMIINRGGQLSAQEPVINTAQGSISGHGLIRCAGGLFNRGRIEFDGDTSVIGPVVNRSGTLILHDDARVAFRGALTVGRPIEGLGKVAVAGRLRLGDKPKAIARIRVEGDLRFEQESSLEIELGGPDPGQFDALVVGGAAALDGTLVVRTNGNYVPKAGDRFEVLTAKQIKGTFSRLQAPPLPKPLAFQVKQATDVTLLCVVERSKQSD